MPFVSKESLPSSSLVIWALFSYLWNAVQNYSFGIVLPRTILLFCFENYFIKISVMENWKSQMLSLSLSVLDVNIVPFVFYLFYVSNLWISIMVPVNTETSSPLWEKLLLGGCYFKPCSEIGLFFESNMVLHSLLINFWVSSPFQKLEVYLGSAYGVILMLHLHLTVGPNCACELDHHRCGNGNFFCYLSNY